MSADFLDERHVRIEFLSIGRDLKQTAECHVGILDSVADQRA